ncbi:MAG: hypothetical protein HOO21_05100 [Candidatus Marinimicrobia bacterium]|nr:hypothetical protein [Candidatus Neomarinimicrobiota bacterium]
MKLEIDNIQSLIDKGKKYSINDKSQTKTGKLRLKLSDYSRIISDLENISKIKDYYLGEDVNIELSLIRDYDSKLLNNQFLAEYKKLYNKYSNSSVNRSFFSKNYFTPNAIYANDDGLWVTYHAGKFYTANSNWAYWAPMGMTDSVLEPTQYKYVTAEICSDARVRYSNEWNKYLYSQNAKAELKRDIHEFIKKIIPKINLSFKTKRDSAFAALGYIEQIKRNKESQFVGIVEKVRDSGVYIPESKEQNYEYIYKKVKTFGQTLEKLYQSHLTNEKEGNILEAGYYLFNLVATDKRSTFTKGNEKYIKFKKNHKNTIQTGIQLKFLDGGKFKDFSIEPLTNYNCLLISSFIDTDLMSKFFHHESNRHQLPKVKLTEEEINNFVAVTGLTIPSVTELKTLCIFDNNTIENFYQKQVETLNIDKMTTDNFGITGLLSGRNLLLLDENGSPNIYQTNIQITESWGMKSYTLQFDKLDNSGKGFLNIRLKQKS